MRQNFDKLNNLKFLSKGVLSAPISTEAKSENNLSSSYGRRLVAVNILSDLRSEKFLSLNLKG